MIVNKDLQEATGLTRQGVTLRIKNMNEAGCKIETRYAQGKVGAIRVYTDADLQTIVNWRGKKPGRKRKV